MGSYGLPSRAGPGQGSCCSKDGEAGVGSSFLVKVAILLLRKSLFVAVLKVEEELEGGGVRPVLTLEAPEIAQCLTWRDGEPGAGTGHLRHHLGESLSLTKLCPQISHLGIK